MNGLKRTNSKYQAIVKGKTQNKPTYRCENTIIPMTSHLEILGVNIDDQFKFDNHVSEVSKKVSQQMVYSKFPLFGSYCAKKLIAFRHVVTVLEFSFVVASVRLRARFSSSCKDILLSILLPWDERVAVQDVNFSEPNIPSENPEKIALDR